MSNDLDDPDQLPFVCGELEMVGREWPAEECEGTGTLVEDRAEPRPGSIAVDHEWLVKVWKIELEWWTGPV